MSVKVATCDCGRQWRLR